MATILALQYWATQADPTLYNTPEGIDHPLTKYSRGCSWLLELLGRSGYGSEYLDTILQKDVIDKAINAGQAGCPLVLDQGLTT